MGVSIKSNQKDRTNNQEKLRGRKLLSRMGTECEERKNGDYEARRARTWKPNQARKYDTGESPKLSRKPMSKDRNEWA